MEVEDSEVAQPKELTSPSVPASWLPVAQPQLSSNEARSRSFVKVSPSGTATVPFLKEKATPPFHMKEQVISTHNSVLSQSHERKPMDRDTSLKLDKLRNTYKPLVQEKKETRPVSIL